jgi:hypothetical protein
MVSLAVQGQLRHLTYIEWLKLEAALHLYARSHSGFHITLDLKARYPQILRS